MIVCMIEGATRILGKSQGYIGLPVRDQDADGVHTMTTSWEPTPEELAALQAGAKIELTVLGTAHPPVILGVGKVPE